MSGYYDPETEFPKDVNEIVADIEATIDDFNFINPACFSQEERDALRDALAALTETITNAVNCHD
jgi:hypothetical protein